MTNNITPSEFNEKWIASVQKKLTKEIAHKTYNMHLPLTAADIAARAITYALKPVTEGTGEFPTSEKHLMCTARKIAKWAISDAIKKAKRTLECESIDDIKKNNDGTVPEFSPHEVAYVMQRYLERKNHREMLAAGRSALRKLDAFLAKMGFSRRDIKIYIARDLYKEPTDVVCAKHSVSPGNLYKIVSVVKDTLRRHGRALLQD